ncbi:major facilitator superfamily-domain-containing protein [Biscogniauxia mediterranea]|nr:major facilitator superfamily-domain-containing protein [Biscogniauxia mediterranea]
MSRRTTRIEQNSSRVAGVSLSREVLFVMTICAAQLCVYAGIGQVLPVLRITGETFTVTNVSHLAWAVAGYTMMVGAFVLVAGRLGEVFGYKRIFLSGLLWSAVWSAIAGASFYSGTALFIVSRALEGSGVALCLPTGLALLGATYPTGRRKAAIFALVAMMAPTGLIVGAAGASALTLAWWPLVYWAFTLTLLGVTCFGAFTIPNAVNTNKANMSTGSYIGDLDILGMFTGVSSLVLAGFVCIQVPMVGWQEPYLWVALICDVLLAVVFVLNERYYAPKPLVPFSAITSEVGVILSVVACGWSCFGIWIFYTWQIVEGLENVSPLLSTAYFSPVLVVGCCAVATMGLTLHRLGPSITMCIALFTFMAGSLLIVTMPTTQIYWAQLFVGILLTAWGMNTCMPAATLMLSNAVDQKYHSVTSNLVSVVMFYSMALGLGAAGTVEGKVNDNGATTRGNLRGYRAAIWTGVGLAGLGFIACLGLSLSLYRRRRVRHCKCHGERGSHHQI